VRTSKQKIIAEKGRILVKIQESRVTKTIVVVEKDQSQLKEKSPLVVARTKRRTKSVARRAAARARNPRKGPIRPAPLRDLKKPVQTLNPEDPDQIQDLIPDLDRN
jgi:hypothetical protein